MKKDIKILLSKILSSFLILIIFSFLIPSFAVADTIGDTASTLLTFAQLNALVPGLGGVIAAYNLVGKAGAGVLGYISDGVINALANMLLGGSTALLGLGVQLLNWVVSPDFMKGMGITNNFIIDIGWGTVRNVANIALIFGLIVIAISIILGYQEGKAKKTLINFILIALLINFTPVICGLIVDACNIVMHSFLNSMTVSNGLESAIGGGISKNGTALENFTTSIVFVIFALVGFVIYLLYSILFIARYIVLWILVIASPIAFASKVFPQYTFVKKLFPSIFYWDEWWEQFLQWSILGIIAGFSLFLSNSVMGAIVSNQALITGSVTDKSLNIFYYIVPLVFLISGFFISISYGGKVGAALGGAAMATWAMSGGKLAQRATDKIKSGGEWAGERLGAAGTKIQEGAVGMAGTLVMDKSNQPRDLSMFNKEDRETGRQAWAGWKKRAVQETPLKYLTTPPELGKDKDAALDNYGKNWNRYSTADRDKMEKMLIDKDPSAFLKGAIDKDKNTVENSREYQRRLAAVSNHGGDKAKFEAYLHASGNTQYMGAGGLTTVNKWATDNKIDDVGKKIRSMSAKDARDKIGADAIKQNPDILKNMGSKMTVSIMQQGSEEQRSAMKEKTIGRNNNDFNRYLTDQGAIMHDPASSVDEKEQARVNIERGLKVANEVAKNS